MYRLSEVDLESQRERIHGIEVLNAGSAQAFLAKPQLGLEVEHNKILTARHAEDGEVLGRVLPCRHK